MANQSLPSVDANEVQPMQHTQKETAVLATECDEDCGTTRQVHVKQLTGKQGRKLIRKLRELQDAGEKLENGKFVSNKSLVVKWLIETYC